MHQMRIWANEVSSVMLKSKKFEIRKTEKTVNEQKKRVSWNWTKDRAILRGNNPSFRDEFIKLFAWQFNSYSSFEASADVLRNWAVETLGDWCGFNRNERLWKTGVDPLLFVERPMLVDFGCDEPGFIFLTSVNIFFYYSLSTYEGIQNTFEYYIKKATYLPLKCSN
jgi:hypothetical protein